MLPRALEYVIFPAVVYSGGIGHQESFSANAFARGRWVARKATGANASEHALLLPFFHLGVTYMFTVPDWAFFPAIQRNPR